MTCKHKDCPQSDEVFLPSSNDDGIRHYKYCVHCGTIHEFGGKRMGFWQGILSTLTDIYDLKEVQVRLIMKDIESFDDTFGFSFEMQRKEFLKILKKYTNINDSILDSFI